MDLFPKRGGQTSNSEYHEVSLMLHRCKEAEFSRGVGHFGLSRVCRCVYYMPLLKLTLCNRSVFRLSCILHSCRCVSYLSPGPSGPWCGWHRSRCRAWSGQRSRGRNPQEKIVASVNGEGVWGKTKTGTECHTQMGSEWCHTKPNEYRGRRGWKSVNMWSRDQTTLSSLLGDYSFPSHLALLSTMAFSSSQSNQWTAASINRPHALSCQAYKSASDAPVTPPQLFINLKISKIMLFIWTSC